MTTIIQSILDQINACEAEASRVSTELQRHREELVARFGPVQVGDVTQWESMGETNQVKVTNVQVAHSGRAGHKFVATGNVLTADGTETTTRATHEWEIDDAMIEAADPKKAAKATQRKK